MAEPIRVLIVDDHPVVRAGLEGMLASQPDIAVAGEAANGAEAVAQVERQRPDAVLMDWRMPGVDGVAATTRIKQQLPATQVLVLTTYDSDADITRAIGAGATGYLLKDAPREELFRAVHAAARGESLPAPAGAARLLGRLRAPAEEPLSPREIEALTLVARGASNRQVARQLWLSEATVKSHLIHIFNKLGVADRTAAVTLALERGILRLDSWARGGPDVVRQSPGARQRSIGARIDAARFSDARGCCRSGHGDGGRRTPRLRAAGSGGCGAGRGRTTAAGPGPPSAGRCWDAPRASPQPD